MINNIYVKELKRLNRNLKNVIILDNNPNAYSLNIENGIPIKSFIDDKTDNELIQMAYVLEKLSKVNDVRVLIKELVYMNQIDYDKTFELFKQKESYHNNIIETNNYNYDDDHFRILSEPSMKAGKSKNNSNSKPKTKVRIVSVEKVDIKPFSSQNNSSTTIKDSKNIINNSKVITTTSFYSTNKTNTSQSSSSLGKSFCSLGQKSNSKGKCLAFSNINKVSKDKKVIVLPKTRMPKTEYIDSEISTIKIKKTKTALNQSLEKTLYKHNKYNNIVTKFESDKFIEEKETSQRPASVIPLKTNSNKASNIIGLNFKQAIIKEKKQKEDDPTNKRPNIPNIQLNVDISKSKPLLAKGNQSNRITNNNLQTTTPYPHTQRKSKIGNSQTSVNMKQSGKNQSLQNKPTQVAVKLSCKNKTKDQNKDHQSKSDFKIIKVISNKELSCLMRSKTSMDKSNHFKNNNKQPH